MPCVVRAAFADPALRIKLCARCPGCRAYPSLPVYRFGLTIPVGVSLCKVGGGWRGQQGESGFRRAHFFHPTIQTKPPDFGAPLGTPGELLGNPARCVFNRRSSRTGGAWRRGYPETRRPRAGHAAVLGWISAGWSSGVSEFTPTAGESGVGGSEQRGPRTETGPLDPIIFLTQVHSRRRPGVGIFDKSDVAGVSKPHRASQPSPRAQPPPGPDDGAGGGVRCSDARPG